MRKKTYAIAVLVVLASAWLIAMIVALQYSAVEKGHIAFPGSAVSVASSPSYGAPYGGASFQSVAPMRTSSRAVSPAGVSNRATKAMSTSPYSSSFTLITTSSATVHSIGSGGGGGIATGGTSSRASRQGISYGTGFGGTSGLLAVSSMPLVARSVEGGMTSEQTYARISPRRAIITGDDDYGDEPGLNPNDQGGGMSDPFFTPVGDIPWALMLLLATGILLRRRQRQCYSQR